MSTKMNEEISLVILCYKAGDRVYELVQKVVHLLDDSALPYEIILVGNYMEGTDDKTPEIVKDIASKTKNVKALALPKKGMMGWDARNGMNLAGGRYICLIDGDEQVPIHDLIRVYEKIKQDHLDFVQTYRMARHDGFVRSLISTVYNFVFKLLFPGSGVRDVNSKPKILTKEAYNKMNLQSDDWFIDAEMVIKSRRLKLKTDEISTVFYKCHYRKSYVNVYAVFEFIKNLLIAKIQERRKTLSV